MMLGWGTMCGRPSSSRINTISPRRSSTNPVTGGASASIEDDRRVSSLRTVETLGDRVLELVDLVETVFFIVVVKPTATVLRFIRCTREQATDLGEDVVDRGSGTRTSPRAEARPAADRRRVA